MFIDDNLLHSPSSVTLAIIGVCFHAWSQKANPWIDTKDNGLKLWIEIKNNKSEVSVVVEAFFDQKCPLSSRIFSLWKVFKTARMKSIHLLLDSWDKNVQERAPKSSLKRWKKFDWASVWFKNIWISDKYDKKLFRVENMANKKEAFEIKYYYAFSMFYSITLRTSTAHEHLLEIQNFRQDFYTLKVLVNSFFHNLFRKK